ncbi:hypothetical protein DYH09_34840 [bacterium CPR1]|nr:hypothetical protein [bacterium CPR1]
MPLESELKLFELHRFRATESARLEAEGWEFFDEQGRHQPALSASQIGRDREPWIEAGDPATPRERLERFAGRLEKVHSCTAWSNTRATCPPWCRGCVPMSAVGWPAWP